MTTLIIIGITVISLVGLYIYLGRPGKSTDKIINKFTKIVTALEAHAEAQQAKALGFVSDKLRLEALEAQAKEEAAKAAKIALQIKSIVE